MAVSCGFVSGVGVTTRGAPSRYILGCEVRNVMEKESDVSAAIERATGVGVGNVRPRRWWGRRPGCGRPSKTCFILPWTCGWSTGFGDTVQQRASNIWILSGRSAASRRWFAGPGMGGDRCSGVGGR